MLVAAGAILFLIGLAAKPSLAVSRNCLDCLCEAESCDAQVGLCTWEAKTDTYKCGVYRISYTYWVDCGKPLGDWVTCMKLKTCSETCIEGYMNKWAKNCIRPRKKLTCEDIARVHIGGPNGCKKKSTIGYGNKVKQCCKGKGGC